MYRLKNKTTLITGGGTGIGRAIALACVAEGCQVVIAGRRDDKLKEVAAEWRGEPAILTHNVDVADRASVSALFEWATEKLGPIDILVNAAGINTPKRTTAEILPDMWDKIMAINATGAYNCIHAVLPQMRGRHEGLIINISSTGGKRASMLGGVAYCASKFAMTGLGTTVALEEAPHGIRVTNIYPGEVDTPFLESRPKLVSDEHRARCLRADDIAAMVVFIATLPPHVHVPETVIKPLWQEFA